MENKSPVSSIIQIKAAKSSLIDFLRSLDDSKYLNISNEDKFRDIISLVALELGVIIPLGLLIFWLDEYGVITLPDHVLDDSFESMSFLELFFYGVLLAPFLEELIFRGFIVFRRCYPLLLFIDLMTSLGKDKFAVLRRVRRAWDHLFPAFVVASSLLFGYVHIFNYRGDFSMALVPLLVAPQVVSGFFLAFARVRYGLVWSMILHATTNLILLILEYIVPLD